MLRCRQRCSLCVLEGGRVATLRSIRGYRMLLYLAIVPHVRKSYTRLYSLCMYLVLVVCYSPLYLVVIVQPERLPNLLRIVSTSQDIACFCASSVYMPLGLGRPPRSRLLNHTLLGVKHLFLKPRISHSRCFLLHLVRRRHRWSARVCSTMAQ